MSDYDDGGNSGGIIGTIISIVILAFIWPYLLAMLGLYIAYMAALAVLEWIAQNPLIVVSFLLGVCALYAVFRYRLIPKAWRWMTAPLQPRAVEVNLASQLTADMPDLSRRTFNPSTNLYCYWCTKKLGMKAWEKNGKYYCEQCSTKLNSQ